MWGKCECHGMKTQYCPIENKRASGKAPWEPKGRGRGRSTTSRATKAAAPHTCGQKHYDGSNCASTVRPPHPCPCKDC